MRAKDLDAISPIVAVAFTGSRLGMTRAQRVAVSTLLRMWDARILTHGDCVGADKDADDICARLNISRVTMPSNIESMRAHCERRGALELYAPAPPLDRNTSLARWSDALIACPRAEATTGGTWHAVSFALAMRKPVVVIGNDGTALTRQKDR